MVVDLAQQIFEDIFSVHFYADNKMLPFSLNIFCLCDYSQLNRQALITG